MGRRHFAMPAAPATILSSSTPLHACLLTTHLLPLHFPSPPALPRMAFPSSPSLLFSSRCAPPLCLLSPPSPVFLLSLSAPVSLLLLSLHIPLSPSCCAFAFIPHSLSSMAWAEATNAMTSACMNHFLAGFFGGHDGHCYLVGLAEKGTAWAGKDSARRKKVTGQKLHFGLLTKGKRTIQGQATGFLGLLKVLWASGRHGGIIHGRQTGIQAEAGPFCFFLWHRNHGMASSCPALYLAGHYAGHLAAGK